MNFDEAQRLAAVEHKRKQGGEVMGTLTLRDYFAAKAMQALLSSPNCPMTVEESALAKQAYITADALLQAREKK